jgi:hypothetical protein
MAYRIELKEFDSPEGWERIKRFAKREGVPLDEAMIALAEREFPDPPKTRLYGSSEEARLDGAAKRIARDRGVSYAVAYEAALDAFAAEEG